MLLQWNNAFGERFGIQYVDFNDPTLQRYYKASFFEYMNMFKLYQEGYSGPGS